MGWRDWPDWVPVLPPTQAQDRGQFFPPPGQRKAGAAYAMTDMPPLKTARLLIRPFAINDLADVHRLLDVELREAPLGTEKLESLDERAEWLQWAEPGTLRQRPSRGCQA